MKASTIAGWAAAGLLSVATLAGCASSGGSTASPGFASGDCTTWTMKAETPANGDLITGGVRAIRDANSNAQAKHAALVLLGGLKVYPAELVVLSQDLTGVAPDVNTLVDTSRCATPAAVNLDRDLATVLRHAQITPSTVPANWYNSFTSHGGVYTKAGVSGSSQSRKSIRIVVSAGVTTTAVVTGKHSVTPTKVVMGMARCGNLATPGPAPGSPAPKKPVPSPSHSPTPTPTQSRPTPISTPTPTPTQSRPTFTPTPTPTHTHCGCSSPPPPTCQSKYGPGFTGTYPDCHKDGSSNPSPNPTNSAPGGNPSPNPTADPGSNKCYNDQGQPASCPPTS